MGVKWLTSEAPSHAEITSVSTPPLHHMPL